MDLDALIRLQHGVCSRAQARDAGLSDDTLRWRVTSGRWSRIGQGLYCAQTGDLDWLGRAHAAVLRGGEGCALSLRCAEYLYGVTTTAPAVITVAVPPGRSVTRLPGTRFRGHVGLDGRARHRHRHILTVALGVVAEGAESLMEVSYVRKVEEPHGLPRAAMQVRDGIRRHRADDLARWVGRRRGRPL